MELDTLPITNRFKLLKVLGGRCRMCKMDTIKHLQIDHIYDDGADERTKYGPSEKIYGWYIEHQEEAFRRLQPLCREHHDEKHHPIFDWNNISNYENKFTKMQLFMDVIKSLEGVNREPVPIEKLEVKLKETGFEYNESSEYITQILREGAIYESKPGCYNSV